MKILQILSALNHYSRSALNADVDAFGSKRRMFRDKSNSSSRKQDSLIYRDTINKIYRMHFHHENPANPVGLKSLQQERA